jgi:HK97 family phage major capsid protein
VSDIKELREKVAAKRAELKELFEANEDVKYSAEQKGEIQARNEELSGLVEEVNILSAKSANEKAMSEDSEPVSGGYADEAAPTSTIGDAFVKSDAYQNYIAKGVGGIDSTVNFNPMGYKATLGAGTTNSYPPEVLRQPGVLETSLRDPNAVIGLFDQIETDQNAFQYLEETTFTNSAAEAAEEGAAGEAELDFTEQTAAIRKIAVFLPVTEELLADVSGIQGYVNSRLSTMIRLRLDGQLLSGDGTAPNLEGILDAGKTLVNSIDYSTYTSGGGELNRMGAIYEAITDIRTGAFIEPDAIVMHPNDWYQTVTAVSDIDTSGSKNPLFVAAGGFGAGPQASLWGLKVVPTTAISEGTVLVGRFGGGEAAHVVMKQGIDLAVSDSHSDFFTKGKVAIRATMRVGFPVYKQKGFTKITNF